MDRAIFARLRTDPEFVSLRHSLDTYYGNSANDAAMDALYCRFLKAGDLAFDIGSHVGDRIGSFRRLGARVVAVEPQPDCARVIRAIYGDDTDVTVVQFACGAQPGQLTLHVNSAIRPCPPHRAILCGLPIGPPAGKGKAGIAALSCQ